MGKNWNKNIDGQCIRNELWTTFVGGDERQLGLYFDILGVIP